MWLGWAIACATPPPPLSVGPAAGEVAVASPGPTEPVPRDPTEPRYAATAVLVAWAGAEGASGQITRTRDEAFARAKALRERALAGEDLGAIAAAESDALRARRGALGTWAPGTLEPAFERAVAAVPPGGIAPVAETPQGWWVARRDPVDVRRIGQILVTYQGAWRVPAGRSKAAAEARAAEALRRIETGEPFAEVAAALSDGGRAGADLGLVGTGQLIPAIEAAAWPLDVGEHTAVVESPHGLHVLIRLE